MFDVCRCSDDALHKCTLEQVNYLKVVMLFSQNVDPHLFTFPHPYGQLALGILGEGFDLRTGMSSEDMRDAENPREREMASRQRYGARQPRGRHIPRRQGTRHEGVPTLEG